MMTPQTPATGGPEATWRHALSQGRILLQRARASGAVIFPPRLAEPGRGDTGLDWFEASGLGTVHSLTWVAQKPPTPPYNVVLVDLDEGARLMSRVDGVTPETLHIGQRVHARIVDADGAPLLVFVPLEA